MTGGGSATLEVVEPGLQTTIQDLGRRGSEHLGVPRSGAADPTALAVANLLLANDPGSAALECTLLGPTLVARRPVTIALAGADMGARVTPGDRALATLRSHRLEGGESLRFTAAGDPDVGCRTYLAIDGGVDVPIVLGSRSTSLVGRFGGFEGRALRAGDVVHGFPDGERAPWARGALERFVPANWPASHALPAIGDSIRVTAGPAARGPAGAALFERFLATTWTVSGDSDRRGLRLETAAPLELPARASDQAPHGVVPGTIQLTPSGQPLVLMPDAGTTGGYPVIAIVILADLGLLGQLVPGSEIGFEAASLASATAAALARTRLLASAAAHLASAAAHLPNEQPRP
jgi:biotin-dependent carboxylase-like uncharacterized protein